MKTFSERVIEAALSIPKGKVSTYGDIAKASGAGGQAARSVNGILVRAHRKEGVDIPFHRIVYSNGQIWKSKKYNAQRMKFYTREGIRVNEKGYIEDFLSKRYQF